MAAVRQWIVSVQGWANFQDDHDDQVARSKGMFSTALRHRHNTDVTLTSAYLFLADTIEHLNTDFLDEDIGKIVDHSALVSQAHTL